MRVRSVGGWSLALASLLLVAAPVAQADDFSDFERDLIRQERRAARKAARKAKRAERLEVQRPKREARAFRKLRVQDDLKVRIDKLTTELTWHQTLAAAQTAAKAQQKPILWIQALGDLSGLL